AQDLHYRKTEGPLLDRSEEAVEGEHGPEHEQQMEQVEAAVAEGPAALLPPAEREQPAGDDRRDVERHLRQPDAEQEPVARAERRETQAAERNGGDRHHNEERPEEHRRAEPRPADEGPPAVG